MRLLTILLVLSTFASTASAAQRGPIHGFVGLGELLSMPGTIRIGSRDWEGGQLGNYFLGVQKIFDAGNRFYSTLGLGVAKQGVYSPGMTVGAGWRQSLWAVQLRAELMAYNGLSGYSHGQGVLGIAAGF